MSEGSDTVFEERIRRLRGPDPAGDWLDVRRRARRAHRRTLMIAAAVAVLVAVPTVAVGARLLDILGVTASEESVPSGPGGKAIPHIHGDVLYGVRGGPVHLAEPVLAPLLGQNEPLAVPTPGWREIVYHAWDGEVGDDSTGGTPVLRRIDLKTGVDVELARGAQSVAIARDGRVAFTRASRPRYENSPQGTLGGRFGHVVVAESLDAPAQQWTTDQSEYVVVAWARQTLLVEALPGPGYVLPEGAAGPARGVYALERPGTLRPLPIQGVVAVSPDGRRVLGWWSQGGDSGPAGARLVDIVSGRVVAATPLKLGRRGTWHGDRVVLSVDSGGNAQQLAVLRVRGNTVRLEHRLSLAADPAIRARYGPFLGSPVFRGDGQTVILRVASVTRNERPRFVGFLTCEITRRTCVRGRNLRPATIWGAIVHNPSRPAAVTERP
jgi:hypothetical protein